MAGTMRKGVLLLVLVFVVFCMVTDPSGLAGWVRNGGSNGWHVLSQLFTALHTFLHDLFAKN